MDNLPHLVGRAGLILEIIGTILLASSLAGPERVHRWENNLRAYTNYRGKSNAIYLIAFLTANIVVAIWFVLDAITYMYQRFIGENAIIAKVQSVVLYPYTQLDRIDTLAEKVLLFIAILGLCILGILVTSDGLKSDRFFGKGGIFIVTMFIAVGITALYIVTLILLSPYILAERISIRFNLRPVLGVFGTIVALVGLSMQFWE